MANFILLNINEEETILNTSEIQEVRKMTDTGCIITFNDPQRSPITSEQYSDIKRQLVHSDPMKELLKMTGGQ